MDENRNMIRFWAEQPVEEQPSMSRHYRMDGKEFTRRYGIALILAAAFTVYTILLANFVDYRAEKRVREELQPSLERLELYENRERMEKAQAEAAAAAGFVTGEASKEQHIQREIDAVAAVIAKLSTDQMKLTEASCMLARVMNPSYPDSFQTVANQEKQWMFYDGSDKTFSQHDKELAESIVRPYLESGIIPNGLTSEMVYGAWSTNDFVLRDSYENTANMHTWRYSS